LFALGSRWSGRAFIELGKISNSDFERGNVLFDFGESRERVRGVAYQVQSCGDVHFNSP
jgi:hypothetical protein